MHAVLAALLDVPAAVVLAVVFLLPALEASTLAGVVIPGETALLYGGVLAWYDRVPLPAVFAAGALGAIVGDSIGYLVGARWGKPIVEGRIGRLIGEQRWAAPDVTWRARVCSQSSPAAFRPSRARWCRSWRAARACHTTGSCSATSWAAWCGPSPRRCSATLPATPGGGWSETSTSWAWSWPRRSSLLSSRWIVRRRRRRRAGRGDDAAAARNGHGD